ncbi:MAG: ATP-binding protein [Gemmataceae bacterium]
MPPSAEPPSDLAAGLSPWEPLFAALRPLAQCAVVYDADAHCLFVNKALARWLGRDEAQLVDQGVFDLWPVPFAAREAADVRLTAELGRLERLETREGAAGPREVRAVKYRWWPRGGPSVAVVVFEETSPALPAGAELGLRALGTAHDYNNWLMMIRGQVELLQAAPENAGPGLAELARLIDRAAELPRQLLAFARGAAPARRGTDVHALLRDLEGPLRARAGRVAFEYRLDPAGLTLDVDRTDLARAMFNLAGNALDAMGGQGRLVFETRVEGGFAAIAVQDTGPGIPPEARSQIFDPLVTTRPGGTGLGLAVVRDVVRRHGGRVGCDSEPGQGARFVLEFPLTPERAARPARPQAVWVVDPSADVGRLAGMILGLGGYRARPSPALDEGAGPADVVVVCASLLDPEGVRRLELWLGRNPAARLVVTCTTGPEPPLTAVCAARLAAVLSKPYDAEALLRAVSPGGQGANTGGERGGAGRPACPPHAELRPGDQEPGPMPRPPAPGGASPAGPAGGLPVPGGGTLDTCL